MDSTGDPDDPERESPWGPRSEGSEKKRFAGDPPASPEFSEAGELPGPAETAPARLHPLGRIALFSLTAYPGGWIAFLLGSLAYALVLSALTPASFDVVLSAYSVGLVHAGMVGNYLNDLAWVCLFMRFVDRRPIKELGFSKQDGRDAALGAALSIASLLVFTGIYLGFGWIRLELLPVPWAAWALATLFTYPLIGFAEEVVFRGYLLRNFEEWRGRTVALLATSLLFWLVHLGQGNVHQPLGGASMLMTGATYAMFRYATGSLGFAIGFHAAYDWYVISFLSSPEEDFPVITSMEVNAPPWLVGSIGYTGVADLFLDLFWLGFAFIWYRRSLRRVASSQLPGR
ncbi:MAG: CPBP family intramembrane metalloprotease [Armatimonadetes bacterium]|nr:CPBP family intramembrane metalloprotease [Armatimonadota bacterium]